MKKIMWLGKKKKKRPHLVKCEENVSMCTSELFPNTKEGPCLFLLLLLGEMMNHTYLELVA